MVLSVLVSDSGKKVEATLNLAEDSNSLNGEDPVLPAGVLISTRVGYLDYESVAFQSVQIQVAIHVIRDFSEALTNNAEVGLSLTRTLKQMVSMRSPEDEFASKSDSEAQFGMGACCT
ncbi:hypothetical protein [Pseudopelagicola sp. nBUS_19]|uniref:hypothetical protein n=1 Tax=Pseudopelagicola sp. nBUS_19 TaxID=3395316 RepID=UPI003EB9A2A1